ncbi:sensor domain-containing diguanylate cyclase [Magnetospirillum fulvum]|uniref:diguanylate cyclase n=1 Tax=Magnetospirillum fulvum TaxID=1082 RepID=A0A1H6HX64_MAGFU|nr:diguanylate cyclase [Magnetospirillum fulvum]SEH38928.1 diguanylate cyclase (GGDEF) domain-containing protein [Magnetospirillum fulvum]
MTLPPSSDDRDGKGKSEGKRLLLRRTPARSAETERALPPWPVLVVDDEADIHTMTRVLLRDFTFQDRAFEVISAFSAAEARGILADRTDIPVMLLDVVMETPNAGLDLVRHVREDLSNHRMAIVLRTGQPGEAPEHDVMLAYDINDYRNKTDLTAQRLFTALVGGLRSWISISTIETLNQTLEQRVIERTSALNAALRFSESLVEQLPIPVWVEDRSGRLTHHNRAFRDLFGIGASAGSGLHAADLLPETPDSIPFETALDTGEQRRDVIIGRSRLDHPSSEGGRVGTITDITERKEMERRLRELATTDDLTGALNRRAFFAAITQEAERAGRYGGQMSLVMIDLDHFKQVNDRFGHAAGDRALKLAAQAMRTGLRDIDVLGRLGGEEFAILLPQTPLAGALDVAERLRAAIAQIAIPVDPAPTTIGLTASLGVADRQGNESGPDRILLRADAALYRAKDEGRNRVVS